MKYVVVGDLHGRKPKLHYHDFDALIAPGDFCSDKEIRPFKKQWVKVLRTRDISLDDYIIERVGKKRLRAMERRSLRVGRHILEYLNSFGKPVFIVPGNWDQSYARVLPKKHSAVEYARAVIRSFAAPRTHPFLTRGLRHIVDCQLKLHRFPEFNIVGYGLSSCPEHPRRFKQSLTNAQYALVKGEYTRLVRRVSHEYHQRDPTKPTIFLSHNVPYNTPVDIIKEPGALYNQHFGSTVARDICVRHRPLICIGGHMHEHFGRCTLGRTTVINAGFGAHVNVFLELKEKKMKTLKFHRGKR